MCILFATRSHPGYELILISNRDEFFERSTHDTCWHTNSSILSPYDMARTHGSTASKSEIFGTWIGINRGGRVANILNLRPADTLPNKSSKGPKSRGIIPFMFLNTNSLKDSFDNWNSFENFQKQYPDLTQSGDFSLFYGDINKKEYRIIDTYGQTFPVLDKDDGYSFVLSNNTFNINENRQWIKTKSGLQELQQMIKRTKNNCTDENMLSECFNLASTCTIPQEIRDETYHINPTVTYDTIFVPPLGNEDDEDVGLTSTKGKFYGTRSQIVILVSKDSKHVTYEEKVLHTSDTDILINSSSNPKSINKFQFDIE
ncbi:similar to Saccharomyces cerevisiae YGR127W Putative protein of unknown function [Maudiozyma barnettii]|uniref:Transport and Golgi organization protein 2 n=1 Tax=Maudiozyma barnettii TaxID=61262 RepID=A0A8H2VB62_9SACH|nr:hypothetical protein [Kazachstania barnettii]CAB4252012.1 similar to Saccharomyces cerevisiae YGR127W Putative protein of unknown function [Kazachstania barnettii]CAD1778441.1 similar to Saccharomyces cerevisiae YGR127W Putative protein of unknown function [Kazachstania barnettii]